MTRMIEGNKKRGIMKISDKTGRRVIVKTENISRYWVRDYAGKKGILVEKFNPDNKMQSVRLENNEVIELYPDEFDFIDT